MFCNGYTPPSGCGLRSCEAFQDDSLEMCADCFQAEYVRDARFVQERTMLHQCGPSCYKYSQNGQCICRHHFYHLVDFEPVGDQKPLRVRREGCELNNVVQIVEDDRAGQRGRLRLIREHPTETVTNYAGAVCLRCNLDAQSLLRLIPLSLLDAGPLPTIGPKPEWHGMSKGVPVSASTDLVLRAEAAADSANSLVAHRALDDAWARITDLEKSIRAELHRSFQDAHNAGYYINEYTTKVNVLGAKLLDGLRKATEKHRDEVEAMSVEQGKTLTKAQETLRFLRKMVHMVARLQVKSGSEMAFPMLFGHMSFSTHRTWEISLRYPIALMWKSWGRRYKSSLRQLRESRDYRRTFNVHLPAEVELKGLHGWLVLDDPDATDKDHRYTFVSPKGARYSS